MTMRLVALLLVAVASAAPAAAQAPQSPCTAPEYRALDFWVGDWIAKDETGKPIGTNRITRDEYGNCVHHRAFSDERRGL
jgi:hypothetical protein